MDSEIIVVISCESLWWTVIEKIRQQFVWARATWRINSFSPTSKTMINRWRKQLNCLKYEACFHKLLHTFPLWDTDWSRCCTSSPVSGVPYAQEFGLFLSLMFLTRMPCPMCPIPRILLYRSIDDKRYVADIDSKNKTKTHLESHVHSKENKLLTLGSEGALAEFKVHLGRSHKE